uniref:Uncharacterized protein n=1 Tax=Proboscia inermis TaxID=420281 RepID=A0A7S0C3U8_9STRA
MEKQEWLTEASSLFHNTFKIHEKIDETNMVTDENTVFCFQSIKSLVPYLFDTLSSSSKYEKYYDLWSQRNLSKLLQNDIEILGSTFPNVIINTEVADCPWSSLLRTTSFTNISVETTSPNVCMKNGIGSGVSTKSESRTTNSDSFLGNAVTDTESSLSSPLNTICTKHATVVKLPPSTKTLPLALEVPVKGRLQSNATNNESDKVSSNMLHDEFNFRGSKPLHVSADGKSIHDSDKTVESKGEIKLAEDASEWLGSQQTSLEHAKPDFTAVEHVTNDSLNEDETQKSMESFVDDTIEESFGDFNNFEKDGPDTANDTIEEEDFGDFEAFTDAQFIDSVQTYDL